MASKKKKKSVTSSVTSSVKTIESRQFRDALTRVTSPVVPGKQTKAIQWNRWSP